MSARHVRSVVVLTGGIIFALLALWATRRIMTTIWFFQGHPTSQFKWVYTGVFIMLIVQMIQAHLERPHPGDGTDPHHVVICVPVYHEDPALLRRSLESMFMQSRLPDGIYVVDDGSTAVRYDEIEAWFLEEATARGVTGEWLRSEKNMGKRESQALAVRESPQATVYITVDSDGVLDPNAIEEGLKPFADPKVQSVAGIVLALNNRANLLARFTDLYFVTHQLTDRSAMSTMRSVLVNSGVLALYRAEIIRGYLDGYLHETFLGNKMEFSDDSMLALFALSRGHTVQQPSCFVFTLMPEQLGHHFRQQLRWMRGSFIRGWWRIRYLPLSSWGFWRQLLGWLQFTASTIIIVDLMIVQPIKGHFQPVVIIVPLVVGLGLSLRYFTFRRSDMSLLEQLGIYLLAPVASLWAFFVLRPLRLYAMATCYRTGWGTREDVEINLDDNTLPEFVTERHTSP